MYLSEFINVKRRYTRSINLERDINISDSVLGYIPTNKPLETLKRFIESFKPNSIRRWTITGVYGTGKSSFAHFLAALCAAKNNPIKQNALKILDEQKNIDKNLIKDIEKNISQEGLIRAVVTASREPISYTIVKSLYIGLNLYSIDNAKTENELVNSLLNQVKNNSQIEDSDVIEAVRQVAKISPNGLLLIIDELGKNLEFATNNQLASDLYLLQQIAELPSDENNPKIFVFGILHQAFSEYTYGINLAQKNEWMKIQGRFEDIPFIEAPEQVIKLIGSSINLFDKNKKKIINKWAKEWKENLKSSNYIKNLDIDSIEAVYPLHPLTATLLPILSSKYAQNDRTIFTFLSSQEPFSFNSLIKGINFDDKNPPTIKLCDLYDYFVETAGVLISSRPNFQRWNEIQSRINDAKNIDLNKLNLLKTIGILNLISSGGALRATTETVVNAMCDTSDSQDKKMWLDLISDLEKDKFVTIRKQIDEIRIWEGSDFNIEAGIAAQIEKISEPLDLLLNKYYSLTPIIAQRHSYKTGTLRYFERIFCSNEELLNNIDCKDKFSDGLIVYWTGEQKPNWGSIKPRNNSEKPLIVLEAKSIKILKDNCLELVSLLRLKQQSSELQIDAIARKEILHRINIAQKFLDKSIQQVYALVDNNCFVNGKNLKNKFSLNSILSDQCDQIYEKTPKLWNELINKRELTSQGAMARKLLMNAMIDKGKEENLEIVGNGPEYCIYDSLLKNTGIHTEFNGSWLFNKPKSSDMAKIWEQIEEYCLSATVDSRDLIELYEILDLPPYGIKRGIVPILFLAVYLANIDKISIYFENKFIPKFSTENIEIFVKKPEKFSVKNTQPNSVQSKVIKELHSKLFNTKTSEVNNATVLSSAKGLVRLVNELPEYSKNTRRISNKAIAVRNNITTMTEPDKILFEDLPQSLGYQKFTTKKVDEKQINTYCEELINALKDIKSAYDNLLEDCKLEIINHLNIQSNDMRKELLKRSSAIKSKTIEPCLKRFINAIEEKSKDDNQWLEAVIMVIADKPADSWSDLDYDKFKIQIQDIARRFLELESIYREITDVFGNNINAKKINCMDSEGNEVNKILWIDESAKKKAEQLCNKFIQENKLDSNPKLKEAIIATLIDNVLNESLSNENAGKING